MAKRKCHCWSSIPAGTGIRQYDNLIVGSMEEYEILIESKRITKSIKL